MALTYLQIGSWNIEHLSKEGGREESPYALADHIEMAGIHVLVLQEIYDTTPPGGARRNRELDRVCELLHEHLDQEWKYELHEKRDPSKRRQLCGVMWNASIVEKVKTYKLTVEHEFEGLKLWDRTPHAVKFAVERQPGVHSSVVVIPLHMKSNYRDKGNAKKVREAEARQLVGQIDAVVAEMQDESLILIGDTNVRGAYEKAIEVFEEAGFIDLNAADAATYPGWGGSPFDRAFVRESRKEFRYSRQYILQSADSDLHDRYLSDHYMIKLSVKLHLDDADPRQ